MEYDPRWSILYKKEEKRILGVVGKELVDIEHVRSTAVPSLGSKPIIDIMTGNLCAPEAEECMLLLQDLGYTGTSPRTEKPD